MSSQAVETILTLVSASSSHATGKSAMLVAVFFGNEQ